MTAHKLITEIKLDLDKHYDPITDLNDIAFVSIVVRNLPKNIFIPFDKIIKYKTAYLIDEFYNIDIYDYIIEIRKANKNEEVKKWVKDKKYHCDICNKELSYMSKSDHLKTKKHKAKQELKNQSEHLEEA